MNPNLLDIDFNFGAFTSTIQQEQSTWSQELRLESNDENELDWVAGLFYSDDEIKGTATRFVGMDIVTQYVLESENLAGFASFSKPLSESDTFGLSARYDRYDKGLSRTNTLSPPTNKSKDFSGIAGSANWQHKISDTTFINLRLAYAEKPGGYSAFTDTVGQEVFSEEKITTYEASIDLSPSETWQFNLTAFFNDIEDYQFELNGAGMDYYLENAEEATVYGVEIDSTWLIEGGWAFSASYGLMESEFKKVSALPALNGKQLGFVPSHSLSLLLSHDLENGMSYQIGSRTIGKSYYWNKTGTNSSDHIGTYTLIDSRISYEINDWNVAVFGSNLTDEEYYTSLVSNLGFPSAPGTAGSPRVIGLSVSKEF
tara:strand:- start:62 stop:1174 length:1113 start_codon:yes stop_codon:yes gene_type:complete